MNMSEALNGLVSDLVRRGLPSDYAERAAAELADHHGDLVDELQRTGWSESQAATEASRRLGDSRTLVKKTVREYQRRYWCARWPLITFLLGPIPMLVLTYAAIVLVLYIVLTPLEKLGLFRQTLPDGIITGGEWLMNLLAIALTGFVAPAITMLTLARLAKRAALDWRWLVVSACLLGLTVGMVRCGFREVRLNPTVDGKPVLADQPLVTVGFPLLAPTWRAAWKWYAYDLQQICQVLLPLLLVAAFSLRAKQLSLRAQRLATGGC
ncbi:MAG TPA: hypothetical protein VJ809_01970 [Pirellulales bacterium]|nr:hypothetical protein [Pirellulales bacterium]